MWVSSTALKVEYVSRATATSEKTFDLGVRDCFTAEPDARVARAVEPVWDEANVLTVSGKGTFTLDEIDDIRTAIYMCEA